MDLIGVNLGVLGGGGNIVGKELEFVLVLSAMDVCEPIFGSANTSKVSKVLIASMDFPP